MNFINRCLLLKCSSIVYKNTFYRILHVHMSHLKLGKEFIARRISTTSSNITSSENIDELEIMDEFENYEEPVDIQLIADNDPEKIKKLEYIKLEIEIWRQKGQYLIPTEITAAQWQELLNIQDQYQQRKFLRYLFYREKRKILKNIARQRKHELYIKAVEERAKQKKEKPTTNSPVVYNLNTVSLFNRICPSKMIKFYNYKAVQAMMFGPPILVDCSYEEYMTQIEISHCAQQIMYMWSNNRYVTNPFNLILCNIDLDGSMMPKLNKLSPKLYQPQGLINFTEKHYLDMFPKDKLVYLTPHCNNELDKYDYESVYIIGAYVDEKKNVPASLAKAKRDGLRTAKLPLDTYLNWCQGSKLLPINQVLNVMNDLKDGASWQYALRHIPFRKQMCSIFHNDINRRRKNALTKTYIRERNRNELLYNVKCIRLPAEEKTTAPIESSNS